MIPEHRPTRLPVFLASALSKLYSVGINHCNRQYDKGIGVTRLDRPVISIGNLSTGGTGKTPLVQYLVRLLIEHGHTPCIAMRGYKSKPNEIGDEQQEHMDALPGVPIVAQPDRIAGLQELFEKDEGTNIDSIVLDDGFQHRKIGRDQDIVVIDASRPPYHDALLPLGFLREQAGSLSRAGMVVISHAEMVQQEHLGELRRWIDQRVSPGTVVAVIEHCWEQILEHSGNMLSPTCHPVEFLDGKPVALLSGIGHPEAFAAMAIEAGAHIVHRCDRPDHDTFPDGILEAFLNDAKAQGAGAVLTTMKDWTKLSSRIQWVDSNDWPQVFVPILGIRFRSGQGSFNTDNLAACEVK
jgi:tetraacyldisaccharide 4'-kinase